MSNSVTVYGLASDDGCIRYVGQTIQSASKRLIQHMSAARNRPRSAVHKWISACLQRGGTIQILVLAENAVWHQDEISIIAHHKSQGADLLNLTDGGEGTLGYRHKGRKRPDLAERNRANAGKPGRPRCPEETEKLMAYVRGSKRPWVSERNKARKGLPGRKHTEEHKAKVASPEWQLKCRAGEAAAKVRRMQDGIHA